MLGYVLPLFFVTSESYPIVLLQLCSPPTPLSAFCATLGIPGTQSSAVISLIAAGNFIGRLSSGFLADKAGTLNTLAIFTFINGLLSIVFWQFARSFAAMAVFGILWGITAGGEQSQSMKVSCHANRNAIRSLLVTSGTCLGQDCWAIPTRLSRLVRVPHERRTANHLRPNRLCHPRHYNQEPRHLTRDARGVSLPHHLYGSRERLCGPDCGNRSNTSLQGIHCLKAINSVYVYPFSQSVATVAP